MLCLQNLPLSLLALLALLALARTVVITTHFLCIRLHIVLKIPRFLSLERDIVFGDGLAQALRGLQPTRVIGVLSMQLINALGPDPVVLLLLQLTRPLLGLAPDEVGGGGAE